VRIAIVIPVLNEAESLPRLIREINEVMARIGHEHRILVVDDGSSDNSSQVARENGADALRAHRNSGKSAALQAGFDATTDADVVITMDGDLQDNPVEIPRMLKALETSDMVSGWKVLRRDPWSRRIQSRFFGGVVRRLTGIALHDFNCGFKGYRRRVLDAIRLTGDQHRLIPALAVHAGFSVSEIEVDHRPREHGRSRFGIGRAFAGPVDLVTVLFLTKFGQRPLHIFGGAGLVLGLAGFIIALYLTFLRLALDEAIGDRPLLLLAVLLLMAGIQLFAVGLLGEMIISTERVGPASRFHAPDTSTPPANTRGISSGPATLAANDGEPGA
jgi:glycosyltransferase involved in cell wall biosynthesis